MAELTEAITLWEAFKFLGPLVGGGGITAIAVAYFGSRRPQLPQKADPAPSVGISALLADHLAMERFTTEIRRLADAAEDISKVGGRLADMMDIAAAVERLTQTKQKG